MTSFTLLPHAGAWEREKRADSLCSAYSVYFPLKVTLVITPPRHSRESGNPCWLRVWIPAFAGTTKGGAGMTKGGVGMTKGGVGTKKPRHSRESGNPCWLRGVDSRFRGNDEGWRGNDEGWRGNDEGWRWRVRRPLILETVN